MTGHVIPPPMSRRLSDLFPRLTPREIADKEKLTHFGFESGRRYPFMSAPQLAGSREMSLILGRKTPQEAAALVGHQGRSELHRARYTTAGMLRSNGFLVEHDPHHGFVDHVRVYIEDEVWTVDIAMRFNSCFAI